MNSSIRLIQFLLPLLCIINGANAFVTRGPIQVRQLQQENRVLFEQPPTFEKQALKMGETSLEKGEEPEEETETQKLMKKVKEAGTAGVISYALWELAFWAISVPVCAFGYYEVTGHWPNLADADDQKQLGAEAFAFVNFARFAVPLRIGLALSTTGWIDENIVKRFMKKDEEEM